jgi:hypothetical protein
VLGIFVRQPLLRGIVVHDLLDQADIAADVAHDRSSSFLPETSSGSPRQGHENLYDALCIRGWGFLVAAPASSAKLLMSTDRLQLWLEIG